jgi:type VI secretion system secreted protein Hcp
MAVDFFLKIEGIKGESHDSKHKDEIDIKSWSWGETNAGSSGGGGGGGSGKVSMQDFHFVMNTNSASPDLLLNCANGAHITKAQLTCRKAGKDAQEYLKITFEDLMISSYQTGGTDGNTASDLPVDQISFNFSTIKMEYAPQNAKGQLGTPIIRGYNIKTNKTL